jgi:hypothetical protein
MPITFAPTLHPHTRTKFTPTLHHPPATLTLRLPCTSITKQGRVPRPRPHAPAHEPILFYAAAYPRLLTAIPVAATLRLAAEPSRAAAQRPYQRCSSHKTPGGPRGVLLPPPSPRILFPRSAQNLGGGRKKSAHARRAFTPTLERSWARRSAIRQTHLRLPGSNHSPPAPSHSHLPGSRTSPVPFWHQGHPQPACYLYTYPAAGHTRNRRARGKQ